MDYSKIIFLLGGYDLEMSYIEYILKEKSIKYYSHNLSWNNAMLSSYKDQLAKYGNREEVMIYGIELIGTTNLSNYTLIDHHNENQNRPSSLEQVASLLGITLNREQILVAANDRGYIPEMLKLGATQAEIDAVRKADRAMQGVSHEDELLAQNSIKQNMHIVNEMVIINSLTSKFSTICDRVFPCDNLLIYDNMTFVYYGRQRDCIIEYLSSVDIVKKVIYYGGGDNGFVGIARGAINSEKIDELVKTITKL